MLELIGSGLSQHHQPRRNLLPCSPAGHSASAFADWRASSLPLEAWVLEMEKVKSDCDSGTMQLLLTNEVMAESLNPVLKDVNKN